MEFIGTKVFNENVFYLDDWREYLTVLYLNQSNKVQGAKFNEKVNFYLDA